MTRSTLFSALGMALVALIGSASAQTLYVSTQGRAGWSGRLDKPNAQVTDGPLPTVAAARDRICEMRRSGEKGPFTVLVRGGTYFLSEPFVLTFEDSGTAAAPVVYAAYPNERPILSGGTRLGDWTKGTGRLWTAPAPFAFN